MRLKPPMMDGTDERIPTGNCSWAKFAVPVMVESTITGRVKRILNF